MCMYIAFAQKIDKKQRGMVKLLSNGRWYDGPRWIALVRSSPKK